MPIGQDRTLLVDRLAQGIDDAADHRLTDWHLEQFARRRDRGSLRDPGVVAQDHHANGRFLEVERDSLDTVFERHHLAGHQAGETVDARNTISHLEDLPHFAASDFGGELLDFTLDD